MIGGAAIASASGAPVVVEDSGNEQPRRVSADVLDVEEVACGSLSVSAAVDDHELASVNAAVATCIKTGRDRTWRCGCHGIKRLSSSSRAFRERR